MANRGLILPVDYDISKAEAKQKKLNREFEISKQKAANIAKEIQNTEKNISDSITRQKELDAELDRSANKLESYEKGNVNFTAQQFQQELKRNQQIQARIAKEEQYQISQESSLARQNVALDAQNAKTAKIGDQILLNGKKQNKTVEAFEKSAKSADRFGRRLKSLIASALFFSVVTKAFTALRNEFGKLITETGTKTAKLVSQLNGNLAVLGRTLYEGAKPYIEWLLKELNNITKVIAITVAKALGKDINEMEKLVEQTKKLNKSAKGALASFDQINTLTFGDDSTSNEKNTVENIKYNVDDEDLEKTKEMLDSILFVSVTIGSAIAAWKLIGFISQLGLVSSSLANILSGVTLIAAGIALFAKGAIDWDEGLHNGENTLNSILVTLGTILTVIGLIVLGVTAWPVLLLGGLVLLGVWLDNFKDKIDKWIQEKVPAEFKDLIYIIYDAAYGVWDFLKNIFKGLYEIFTGDWEKGLKRIGIAVVNLLVDALNVVISALNFLLYPVRKLIQGVAKLMDKSVSYEETGIPRINRIPQLATGAVLPGGSPMLAWVNDQPKGQTYVEGSVENIAAAFERFLAGKSFGTPTQDNRPIILQIDGKEIARATRSGENKLGAQTVFGGFANVY